MIVFLSTNVRVEYYIIISVIDVTTFGRFDIFRIPRKTYGARLIPHERIFYFISIQYS